MATRSVEFVHALRNSETLTWPPFTDGRNVHEVRRSGGARPRGNRVLS